MDAPLSTSANRNRPSGVRTTDGLAMRVAPTGGRMASPEMATKRRPSSLSKRTMADGVAGVLSSANTTMRVPSAVLLTSSALTADTPLTLPCTDCTMQVSPSKQLGPSGPQPTAAQRPTRHSSPVGQSDCAQHAVSHAPPLHTP